MVDDVCSDCEADAENAEELVSDLPDVATAADIERALRQLATILDDELPFTPLAFGVISRKVLALLAMVHPAIDTLTLSEELDVTIAHMLQNAVELAAFIRVQLEAPTLNEPARIRAAAGAR